MSEKTKITTHSEGIDKMINQLPDDAVVISGIAGRFPQSDNLMQLQENLFKGIDLMMVENPRWKFDDPEIPSRIGTINNLEKFDSVFFGIHSRQANSMDPMCRILMEHAYEAIIDSGINPRQLRGTKTGVFIGASISETEKSCFSDRRQTSGPGIIGCSRSMFANRISYWLDLNGPSYNVDTACSSSLTAFDHAYTAIKSGRCDAALVGGSQLCLHPLVTLQFSRLGILSPDGYTKSFDADANGYSRSEAISVILLQKAKDAKRVYAHVVHTKTNCDGFKERGITVPSSTMQVQLLQECYEECGVPPSSVAYVEAHGTGTAVGDPEELLALKKIFCPGRTTPLRIGSVKSNLGHSEPACGLTSVAKVVIAMETGLIPPNLHYNRPPEGITALQDGSIQVVTELTPWEVGYAGVNSFGFGGANAHALLKSNPKEKIDGGKPNDDLPRLVVVSGRTEEAVTTLLNALESRPVDVEYISLFHNIHSEDIPGHLYRGYTLLPPQGLSENIVRDVQHYPGEKRPIWFVFSGMGSQWVGMGEDLLTIPVFAKAIHKCDAVLKDRGLNIVEILTSKNPRTFNTILHSFVGIAAVQIGLVDVLTSLEIVPDNIIGHSVGELGCAYADGCLTAEQTVLAAYSRGVASVEIETARGSMVAVGLGYDKLKDLCPIDIDIACHNGPESSTISGPTESVKKFVSQLQARDIFAKEIPCNGIAYHSRYIAAAGPKLLTYLRMIIPDPKPISPKWLSTCVAREEWANSPRFCSPEYQTHNLLNPVLFEEICRLVPDNAVTIEISPHGLLQAILRKSLNKNVINVPLTKHGHKNNAEHLLGAIGKLYEVGLHPQLSNLYPKVQYPVSRGTPMISPLVRWEHSYDWHVFKYNMQNKLDSGARVVSITFADGGFDWIHGYIIGAETLVPATVYLELVWETLALMQGRHFAEVSVVFEDVKFHRTTAMPKEGSIDLSIMIHKGTGRFEIDKGDATVVTGLVRPFSNAAQECLIIDTKIDESGNGDEDSFMTSKDIYKELYLRGYQLSGVFRSLRRASANGTKGRVAWMNNWVAFIDNMLQMQILSYDTRELVVPIRIEKLVIDVKEQSSQLRDMHDKEKEFTVTIRRDLDLIKAGGVEIRGFKASPITFKNLAEDPVLENVTFVAHRDQANMTLGAITRVATQIVLENHLKINIKTIELISTVDNVSLENLTSCFIQRIIDDIPSVQADISIVTSDYKFDIHTLPSYIRILEPEKLINESGASLVIAHGLLASRNSKVLKQLVTAATDDGFFLAREPLHAKSDVVSFVKSEGFDIVMEKQTDDELIMLLRMRNQLQEISSVIRIDNHEFTWLPRLQDALKKVSEKKNSVRSKILLVSEGDLESGLLGLVNCLRKEPDCKVVQSLLIQDLDAPKFSLNNAFYSDQLKLGLASNVLRPGKIWGSYRFLLMDSLTVRPVYHARISQLTRGDLSALKWVEGRIRPSDHLENIIKVHYASLNFRDVMISTGKLAAVQDAEQTRLSQEHTIGFEFSGVDSNGRAVMGMNLPGAFSNFCAFDGEFLWPVPDTWTLEDAATVPIAYGTAYYALHLTGRMSKGEKVLIHAGSDGVGQAAITLAVYEGCEVFTTVETLEKREFIKRKFPQIDDAHIGHFRDTSFENWITRETHGRGVDIVLSSLTEENLEASVRCLARYGRFLEIGKYDMAMNSSLGMEAFSKDISFHGVQLDSLFSTPSKLKSVLSNIVAEGIKIGVIKPLVRTIFPMEQVEAAFGYMAAGKHIGKVILRIREGDRAVQSRLPLALPRYYCMGDRSYIIHGGLGGLGLELADWLVLRGAKKLLLTSRKGISNGYQRRRISVWRGYGVKVVIFVGKDASTHDGCEAILKEAIALGPVDAIFNLAVVLKDNLFENQTPESFEESFRAKATTTKQFDKLSRTLCPHLRQFVVFSSTSSGRGYGSQTNYGMANSIMERICEMRAAENLPGLAIQWGCIGDVGLVAEMREDHKKIVIAGISQQGILSCLEELNGFLLQSSPVVSSMVVAEKKAVESGIVNLIDTIINIIGIKDIQTISLQTSLAELGIDSMMAVEIRRTLKREFGILLTAQEIRDLNFVKIRKMSVQKIARNENLETKDPSEIGNVGNLAILLRTLGSGPIGKDISVTLNTKSENGREEVFLLPGIEGTHNVFLQPFANKLKSPTTCLQFGSNFKNLTTINDMADYFIPLVRSKTNGRKKFVVAGYSFGSMVAIELVRRLESEGFDGRLILLDGSPDYVKAIVNQQFNTTSEHHLQNDILLQIMKIAVPSFDKKLAADLQKCNIWDEKVAACLQIVPQNDGLNLKPEDLQAKCSAVYFSIRAILNYDASVLPSLKTSITLLKSKIQAVHSVSKDYGVGSLTQGKIEIHCVEGDHITMLNDDLCAAVIDGDFVEEFIAKA